MMIVTRPVQINTGTRSLMPAPALVMKMAAALPNNNRAANVNRDKKTGGNCSAAGDDDVAARWDVCTGSQCYQPRDQSPVRTLSGP